MSRPLRLEFVGALYHVTSRGDRREPIVEDDTDRQAWLAAKEGAGLAFCLPRPISTSYVPPPSVWNSKTPTPRHWQEKGRQVAPNLA